MVPKLKSYDIIGTIGFRAVLFRMVPKQTLGEHSAKGCFRAVLFRMVPKLGHSGGKEKNGFRAVLFRMVPKLGHVVKLKATVDVLETFLSAIKHDDGEFYHGSERRAYRASGSLSERVGKST